MSLPKRLMANAWRGHAALGNVGPDALHWTMGRAAVKPPLRYLAPAPLDLNEWRDPRVGWGLIVDASASIPAALQELRKKRGDAPVFRYDPDPDEPFVLIDERTETKVEVNAAPRGTDAGALPFYLLIYGPPSAIPWRLQYVLNMNRCVGRLDLKGAGLANYVTALMESWSTAKADPKKTVLWSVDCDAVTTVMRTTIGDALQARFQGDADEGLRQGAVRLAGGDATLDALRRSLEMSPALVVTTSHGQTAPVENKAEMKAFLGVPVDQDGTAVSSTALDGWEPNGAIWYAHACCSAGSDAESGFAGLFPAGDELGDTLAAVAALGSTVAPLPKALLGAKRPLRAFIGHVEPTFDWTLQHPGLETSLAAPLVDALYQNLFTREPVGHALRDWYARVGGLAALRQAAQSAFDRGADREADLLFCQLAARDIESTVVLGDPTVTLA